jgi:hypothetical protein
MDSLTELENRLRAAREKLDAAVKALAPRHQGGEPEAYDRALAELLALERALAAAKGEPYAEDIDFPVQWDMGAPLPHLLVNDAMATLAFLLGVRDPAWDGTSVTVVDPGDDAARPLALVTFDPCVSAKLGAPNDEVFHGHPLAGRGQKPYGAQRVIGSPWLAELEAINSVHAQYNPKHWRGLKHYVFWFHDAMFECIATSFTVEIFREPMPRMLERMVRRLFDR